jgi:hypothetical protein
MLLGLNEVEADKSSSESYEDAGKEVSSRNT